MMTNKNIVRDQFLEVVESQLKENQPPETQCTLDRLLEEGFNEKVAKELLATCVATEMFQVISSNMPFDE
jgi:hypothetical protein